MFTTHWRIYTLEHASFLFLSFYYFLIQASQFSDECNNIRTESGLEIDIPDGDSKNASQNAPRSRTVDHFQYLDPNSSYNVGVRKAKAAHNRRRRTQDNIIITEKRIKLTLDRREPRSFPKLSIREIDRSKEFALFKTESGILDMIPDNAPWAMFLYDSIATLFSDEDIDTKLNVIQTGLYGLADMTPEQDVILSVLLKIILYASEPKTESYNVDLHLQALEATLRKEIEKYDVYRIIMLINDCHSFFKICLKAKNVSTIIKVAGNIASKHNTEIHKHPGFLNAFKLMAPAINAWMKKEGVFSTEAAFGDIADQIDDFGTSPLFKHVKTLYSSLAAMHYIPDNISDFLRERFGLEDCGSGATAFRSIHTSSLRICDELEEFIRGNKSLQDLIFGNRDLANTMDAAKDIIANRHRTYIGQEREGYVQAAMYLKDVKNTIEILETLMIPIKKNSRSKDGCRSILTTLKVIEEEVNTSIMAARRDPPFSFALIGPPGIGKGNLMTMFFATLSNVDKMKFAQDLIFAVPPTFWEGYKSWQHLGLHFSEIGSANKNLLSNQGDPLSAGFTSVIDCLPMQAPMAFDNKGKMPVIPRWIGVDSNVPLLGFNHHREVPGAYLRRLLFIDVRVSEHYASDSGMLDTSKVGGADLNVNVWEFSFHKYRATGMGKNDYVKQILLEWCGFEEANEFVRDMYTKHKLQESGNNYKVEKWIENLNASLLHLDINTEAGEFMHPRSLLMIGAGIFLVTAYDRNTLIAVFLIISYYVDQNKYLIIAYLNKGFFSYPYLMITNVVNQSVTTISSHFTTALESKFSLPLLGGLVTVIVGFVCYARQCRTAHTEANIIDDLADREKAANCGQSYSRVPIANHNLWNRVYNQFSPIHKGGFDSGVLNVSSNIRYVRVHKEDKNGNMVVGRTNGFGITEDIMIINRHALGIDLSKTRIGICRTSECDTFTTNFNMEDMEYVVDDNDLLMLRHPSLKFKDRLKHFASEKAILAANTPLIIGDCDARLKGVHFNAAIADDDFGTLIFTKALVYNWTEHAPGSCGMPLMAHIGNGQSIIGIHCAGQATSSLSFAVPLTRELLDGLILKLNTQSYFPPAISECETFPVKLVEPGRKSVVRYEHLPYTEYQGTIPGFVLATNKSKLVQTPLAPHLDELFFKHEIPLPSEHYGRPMMMSTNNKEYISPINNQFRKMDHEMRTLNSRLSKRVGDVICAHLKENLRDIRGKLRPLTVEVAINGTSEDAFLKRMSASKSAGFGWPGKKDKYIPIDESVIDSLRRMPTLELQEAIVRLHKCYENGHSATIINSGKLKDEPRPLAKCRDGKTRMFFVSPIEAIIFARMYLAPFYTLMVERGEVFGTAIGINAHQDFDKLAKDLLNFSKYYMEGDYEGYDTKTPFDIKLIAIYIITQFLEYAGYDEYAIKMVTSFLYDNLFVLVEVLNDIFRLLGLQPSGKFGTAEDNSLVGLVMLVYAYMKLTDKDDFFQKIFVRTYGDDVIAAVKQDTITVFNNNIYQKFCKEHYGMNFTSAAKDIEMTDFVKFEDLSFLKRNFVYNAKFNKYMGVLDHNSLYKSLQWSLPSNFVTMEDQMISTCESFLYEAFFHVNAKNFCGLRSDIQNILSKAYHGCDPSSLPTYDNIRITLEWDYVNDIAAEEDDYFTLGGVAGPHNLISASSTIKTGTENLLTEGGLGWPLISISSPANNIITEEEKETLVNSPYYGMSIMEIMRNPRLSGTSKSTPAFRAYRKLLEKDILSRIKPKAMFKHNRYVTESGLESSEMLTGILDSNKEDIHENFEDHGGESTVTVSAGSSRGDKAGQAEVHDPNGFLCRPVEVGNFVVDPITFVPFVTEFRVWDIVSSEPTVRSKLRNWAYMRADMAVTVNISASPFVAGKILVAYVPYPLRNAPFQALLGRMAIDPINYRPLLLTYLSSFPGAKVMDVKDNQPLTVEVPFISPKPMHRLFNSTTGPLTAATPYADLENAGSLYVLNIGNFSAVTTNPSDVSVFLYASFKNVQLGTLTATQIDVTTESGMEEKKSESMNTEEDVGPIEKITTAMAAVFEIGSSFPALAPFTLPAAVVSGSLAKWASLFGWSRPIMTSNMEIIKRMPFANGATSIGNDTAFKIAMDPKQALYVDGHYASNGDDELIIDYICKREAFLTSFVWAATDTPLTTSIWRSAVHPQLLSYYNVLTRTWYQPTPMAMASLPFNYWRGDIIFRLEVICSAYHRGKLSVLFDPNIAQNVAISANAEINKQYMMTIDLKDTQSVEFCVSWASPFPWMKLHPTDGNGVAYRSAYGSTPFLETFDGYANGFIRVIPFTQLQSPDSSDVEVNVYVKSKSMQYCGLSSLNIPFDKTGLITESGYDTSTTPVSCIDINASTATVEHISGDYFGEKVSTFRSIFKRYTAKPTLLVSGGNTAFIDISGPIYNQSYPAYNTLGIQGRVQWLDYVRFAYLGVRGSMRHRVMFRGKMNANKYDNAHVMLKNPSASQAISAGLANNTEKLPLLEGGVTFAASNENGIEAEFPFYSNNLFVFSCAEDYVGSNNLGEMENTWYRDYLVQTTSDTTSSVALVNLTATGEDFNLVRFQAAPAFTVAQA